MINLCFLKGKIIDITDYKFIYDKNNKGIGNKHICIIKLEIEIENKQIVWLKGYDEIADFIYQKLKKGDEIFVEGNIENDIVEIEEIKKL